MDLVRVYDKSTDGTLPALDRAEFGRMVMAC